VHRYPRHGRRIATIPDAGPHPHVHQTAAADVIARRWPAAAGGSSPRPGGAAWRRWLGLLAVVLLLGPPLVLLAYRFVPPPGTPLMLKRLAQGRGLEREWVPLGRVSPHLARAVIASEDNLFCRHWGIDAAALREQVGRALDGERARGASTITQQTAKNLLLWEGRDPVRKLLEAWLAPQLELILGKRRILEIYLNVIETGPGLYGAEAAARRYFAKPAAKLTPRRRR
jgi:monofunctional biosynthetic peptidoglycan transglycosylase